MKHALTGALMLAACMMLDYLCDEPRAQRIRAAIDAGIDQPDDRRHPARHQCHG